MTSFSYIIWMVVSEFTLFVYATTTATVAPVIIAGPSDVFVYTESALNLNCSLSSPSATDKVEIFWYRNNMPLNETFIGEKTIYVDEVKTDKETMSILRFNQITKNDQGLYTCSSRMGFGPYATVSVHVIVWRTSILIPFEKKKFYRGDATINVTCTMPIISSQMDNNIKWIKNGHILDKDSPRTTVTPINSLQKMSSIFFLSNINVNDSGTYTCAPASKAQADVTDIDITIAKSYVQVIYKKHNSIPDTILMITSRSSDRKQIHGRHIDIPKARKSTSKSGSLGMIQDSTFSILLILIIFDIITN